MYITFCHFFLYKGELQRIFMWNSDLDDLYNNSQCLELDTKFVWDFEWISSTRLVASTYEGYILICETGTDVPIKRLSHVYKNRT